MVKGSLGVAIVMQIAFLWKPVDVNPLKVKL